MPSWRCDFAPARASHSGGVRADLRGHPRGNMVKRLFPGADRRAPTFLCMWVRGRADACTQPLTSARTRGQTTWLQVETASNAHAARSSGRRLRPPARTHSETAGTVAYRSVARDGWMCIVQLQWPRVGRALLSARPHPPNGWVRPAGAGAVDLPGRRERQLVGAPHDSNPVLTCTC